MAEELIMVPRPVWEALLDDVATLRRRYEPHRDYLTEKRLDKATVTAGDPRDIKVREKYLYRSGMDGYVISDDGTILVKINDGDTVTLGIGEQLDLAGLEVDRIYIETTSTSALGFRLFVV